MCQYSKQGIAGKRVIRIDKQEGQHGPGSLT